MRSDDLSGLHLFADGFDKDKDKDYKAIVAGLTLSYSNDSNEGVVQQDEDAELSKIVDTAQAPTAMNS